MKIIYTIAGLYRPAGMERILTSKANYLSEHGYDVVIVTTEQKNRPLAFPLNQGIRCVDLEIGYEDNNGSSVWNKVLHYPGKQRRHRRTLRALLLQEHPDITVSMFCGDESFLPFITDGSRKILEVHFSRYKRLQYERTGLWGAIDRYRSKRETRIAARFDRFVVLTHEDYTYWGSPANGTVIPNFLEHIPQSPSDLTSRIVMAAGRLSHQKAFNRLIDSWNIVIKRLPPGHGWKLYLLGNGELESDLKRQFVDLDLADSAQIMAPTRAIDSIYQKASIFVLTSRYEGLPMVLLEAQSFGIPAVAFDCKCGPRDVITNGEDGFLIPEGDTIAFADALLTLIQNKELRIQMGMTARKNASRWDKETIMKQWISLFQEI